MKAIKVALTMILATTMGAFSLGGLTGCSAQSSQTTSSQAETMQDIEIKESGYSVTEDGKLRYAFVAVNPNEGQLASNVVFSIEAFDKNNKMLAGAGTTVAYMYPGEQVPAAGETTLYISASKAGANGADASGAGAEGGEGAADGATSGAADATASTDGASTNPVDVVSYIQITPSMDTVTWDKTSIDSKALEGELSIGRSRKMVNSDATVEIKSSVTSKLENTKLQIIAILYNGTDNPICGSEPITIEPKPNEETPIDIVIKNAPNFTEAIVFATPAAALK